MSWREAFLKQARSENRLREVLNDPQVEYSHRLHYLQMVTEKLAKGFMADPSDPQPPNPTHGAFVRLLQTIKGRPEIRRSLGYQDAQIFRQFINSLLDLAVRVERLAPGAAGTTAPNPEYPWRDPVTGVVHAPIDFDFAIFSPRDAKMIKLENLLDSLIRIAS
jgi:hypothetical protein